LDVTKDIPPSQVLAGWDVARLRPGQAQARPGSYSGDDTVNLMTEDVIAVSPSKQCPCHGSVAIMAVSQSR
jgi:hypothetical protein